MSPLAESVASAVDGPPIASAPATSVIAALRLNVLYSFAMSDNR